VLVWCKGVWDLGGSLRWASAGQKSRAAGGRYGLGKAEQRKGFWGAFEATLSDADDESRCHMFYEQRLVDIPDGLPKWSGMSGKSDLIEDSPSEAVKKRKREVEEEENGEKNGKSAKK
jgi:hypothetical protein